MNTWMWEATKNNVQTPLERRHIARKLVPNCWRPLPKGWAKRKGNLIIDSIFPTMTKNFDSSDLTFQSCMMYQMLLKNSNQPLNMLVGLKSTIACLPHKSRPDVLALKHQPIEKGWHPSKGLSPHNCTRDHKCWHLQNIVTTGFV